MKLLNMDKYAKARFVNKAEWSNFTGLIGQKWFTLDSIQIKRNSFKWVAIGAGVWCEIESVTLNQNCLPATKCWGYDVLILKGKTPIRMCFNSLAQFKKFFVNRLT